MGGWACRVTIYSSGPVEWAHSKHGPLCTISRSPQTLMIFPLNYWLNYLDLSFLSSEPQAVLQLCYNKVIWIKHCITIKSKTLPYCLHTVRHCFEEPCFVWKYYLSCAQEGSVGAWSLRKITQEEEWLAVSVSVTQSQFFKAWKQSHCFCHVPTCQF